MARWPEPDIDQGGPVPSCPACTGNPFDRRLCDLVAMADLSDNC